MTHHTTWDDLMRAGDATDFFARRPFAPFEPNAIAYSSANALWLAELSRLAYRHDVGEGSAPQPPRSSFLAAGKFLQRGFFSSTDTDTQALLVENDRLPHFAVLIFRGTEQRSPQDIIADVMTGLPPLASQAVCVHAGFQLALDSVWADIADELSGIKCPVYFTGHSLGAALATLAAARHPPRAAYTFGSPRVGNQAFAQSVQHLPIYRVVDDHDAVTWVPPEEFGYRHVGALQVLHDPAAAAGAALIALVGGVLHPPKIFADHAPVNYVDRIP